VHGKTPDTNSEFWRKKLGRNQERDQQVTRKLKEAGWMVLRYWEHEVKSDPNAVADDILDAISRRRR